MGAEFLWSPGASFWDHGDPLCSYLVQKRISAMVDAFENIPRSVSCSGMFTLTKAEEFVVKKSTGEGPGVDLCEWCAGRRKMSHNMIGWDLFAGAVFATV